MPKKTDKIIEPIDASFDEVSKVVATSSGHQKNTLKISTLPSDGASLGTTPMQPSLFHVEKQIEFQDVEMGVLESGVPYLSGRGLARMIGIDHGP